VCTAHTTICTSPWGFSNKLLIGPIKNTVKERSMNSMKTNRTKKGTEERVKARKSEIKK